MYIMIGNYYHFFTIPSAVPLSINSSFFFIISRCSLIEIFTLKKFDLLLMSSTSWPGVSPLSIGSVDCESSTGTS